MKDSLYYNNNIYLKIFYLMSLRELIMGMAKMAVRREEKRKEKAK
jgi:hypothetical protein